MRARIVIPVLALLISGSAVLTLATKDSSPPPAQSPIVSPEESPTPLVTPLEKFFPGIAQTTTQKESLSQPAGARTGTIGNGVQLIVLEQRSEFVRVRTPCDNMVWISTDNLQIHAPAAHQGQSLREATIVIDPGHGGVAAGAVGPGGTQEKTVNLAISKALAGELTRSGARVVLTRNFDHDATLGFRTEIANVLVADAFMSLHNNAEPDGPFPRPGSETYYQSQSAASRRLAGLIYERLIEKLDDGPGPWVADTDAGAKFRKSASGGDFYGVLRMSRRPAVLVESLFISNRPEETLLNQPATHQAMAGALAGAVKAFIETDAPGSGFTVPYPRPPAPSGPQTKCLDPS